MLKGEWRAALLAPPGRAADEGRRAEALRRLAVYRQSRRLFVSPAAELTQIRINALLDGKELIMPGPGLKEGFYLVRPFSVPFPRLKLAVSLKGVALCGRLLRHEELPGLGIDLLLTEALAVDEQGGRLGDGSGFFDLAAAILNQSGALSPEAQVWAAGTRHRPPALPRDPWDVPMHGLIEAEEVLVFPTAGVMPGIYWQYLPAARIRRLTPLWREWRRLQTEGITPGAG
ncbi:MAG: hypothetical protein M0T76_05745 [Desulfobacteraceae bacterium]|nr:hypothetical protein [Desulfobacteraceae bacterium]